MPTTLVVYPSSPLRLREHGVPLGATVDLFTDPTCATPVTGLAARVGGGSVGFIALTANRLPWDGTIPPFTCDQGDGRPLFGRAPDGTVAALYPVTADPDPADVAAGLAAMTGQLSTALSTANSAAAAAANARQMVLARDPAAQAASAAAADAQTRVTTLEQLAATLAGAVEHGNAEHARLDTRVDAALTRMAALFAPGTVVQLGTARTGALLTAGATATLTVTWPIPFADDRVTAGDPVVVPVAGVTLAQMDVGKPTAVTRTGCQVVVKAVGVTVAAGQQVVVLAVWRPTAPTA